MTQIYSNPKRENDPYALPDVETFYIQPATHANGCDRECRMGHSVDHEMRDAGFDSGWYWQSCFPGCLPDGEPSGPFATEAEAIADAREGVED